MNRRDVLALTAGLCSGQASSNPARAETGGDVDLLLVLAVDVSRSIDPNEARLQREGYCSALSHPSVVEAIQSGPTGSVGIAYVEWAGVEHQKIILPWTKIRNKDSADQLSARLAEAPLQSVSWTSISTGLLFSVEVIAKASWDAPRRVIDISGDGVNNSGPPAEVGRDAAVAAGITVNGLPITSTDPSVRMPMPLGDYLTDSVIGGAGAFVLAADSFESFGQAVRRKLIREIACMPQGIQQG